MSITEHKRIKVLISGCLPPPHGGMAVYYQTLIDSRLSEYIDYRFVHTSTHNRELSSAGRGTFSNLVFAVQDCLRFTRALLGFKSKIAHIGTASGLSFLKHSYCVFVAHLFGRRVLLHPHCSLSVVYSEKSSLWQWFFRQVIRKTDFVIALSQEWQQLSSIVPGCQVVSLPNPVDINYYHAQVVKSRLTGQIREPKKALYLGYLGRAKGTFDIIDAALLIRSRGVEILIDLVGSELAPGEISALQEKVKSAGLENIVRINPPAFGEEKLAYFRDADIFIYPSYHEGLPMAVLEAMSSELPIIASRVGGLPDLVKPGINGILIQPGKPDQLADALCDLVKNPEKQAAMGKMSYQLVNESFSIDQHLAKLVNIYESVASPSSTTPDTAMNEALNTPWKITNRLGSIAIYPYLRWLFAINKIPWGEGWRLFGVPILQKHRQSTMSFGPGFSLRSTPRSNPLGANHPVILCTWQPGAVLEIGANFGMTGGALVVAERITIGDNVAIGANTTLIDTDFHPLDPETRRLSPQSAQTAPIIIEDDVFIGMNCLILKGVTIGQSSVIGAGSVVTKNIPPRVIVAGNPARVLREL